MKIAAVYSVYNEEDYLEYSIRSVYDFVDAVIVNVGTAPWSAYNPQARAQFAQRDGTEALADRLAQTHRKLVVRKGVWDSEVAHRDAGMRYCVEAGFDYYFLVDADEIYRRDHLQAIREEIERHPEVGAFRLKWSVLWRSFRYRVPYDRVTHAPWRVFKIDRVRRVLGMPLPYRCRFTGPNRTNSVGPLYLIPPEKAIIYHFGYARTNARMQLKLGTSEGRRQFIDGWYEQVWLQWPSQRSLRNLQPVDPPGLPEAVPADPSDLPEALRDHPYWSLDIIQ